MFLLSILPDFVFHLVVLVGVVGVVAANFLGFIPFVSTYKTPIQLAAIVALVVGAYFEGGMSVQAYWEGKVAEAEKKVLEKQVESAQVNTKIQYVYIEKTKIINENKRQALDSIAQNASTMDAKCTIIPEVNTILNAAAKNQKTGVAK